MSSLLRSGDGNEGASDAGEQALSLGNVSVDLATYQTFVGERPANLTYQEFELLRHLAGSRGRVLSFDMLSSLLWGSSGPSYNRRLNVLVCRLRNKLRDSTPYRLETVRGRGYGFLGPDSSQARGGGIP